MVAEPLPPVIPLSPMMVMKEVDRMLGLPGPLDPGTVCIVKLNPVDWQHVFRSIYGFISGDALDSALSNLLAFFRLGTDDLTLIVVADYFTMTGTINVQEVKDLEDVDQYSNRTCQFFDQEGEEDEDGEGDSDEGGGPDAGRFTGDFTPASPPPAYLDGGKYPTAGFPETLPGLGSVQPQPGEPEILPGLRGKGGAQPPRNQPDLPPSDDDEEGMAGIA